MLVNPQSATPEWLSSWSISSVSIANVVLNTSMLNNQVWSVLTEGRLSAQTVPHMTELFDLGRRYWTSMHIQRRRSRNELNAFWRSIWRHSRQTTRKHTWSSSILQRTLGLTQANWCLSRFTCSGCRCGFASTGSCAKDWPNQSCTHTTIHYWEKCWRGDVSACLIQAWHRRQGHPSWLFRQQIYTRELLVSSFYKL